MNPNPAAPAASQTYGQIWITFRDKFTRQGLSEQELRQIHKRWKWLASQVK